MLLRELFRPFQKQLAKVPAGRLVVWGAVQGGRRAFAPDELQLLPREFLVADVASFASGSRGRALRLAGLLQACAPRSGALCLNAASRDGQQVCSYWLSEVQPLAWILFEEEARALAGADSAPFQLLVPGLSGPRAVIRDLALIEIGSQPETERLRGAS